MLEVQTTKLYGEGTSNYKAAEKNKALLYPIPQLSVDNHPPVKPITFGKYWHLHDNSDQATNENIAEFTEAINNIETMEIANFTSALTAAFTLLERYRTKKVNKVKIIEWLKTLLSTQTLVNID